MRKHTDIYEKSESPFILACGPHCQPFSLSVMKRCGPHALVRCVTNEGVLTFRCFPSKSQLKNTHEKFEYFHIYVQMFCKRIFIQALEIQRFCMAAITFEGFCSKEQTKGLFHFELRGNRSRCEPFMKAVQRQAGKPQRDT